MSVRSPPVIVKARSRRPAVASAGRPANCTVLALQRSDRFTFRGYSSPSCIVPVVGAREVQPVRGRPHDESAEGQVPGQPARGPREDAYRRSVRSIWEPPGCNHLRGQGPPAGGSSRMRRREPTVPPWSHPTALRTTELPHCFGPPLSATSAISRTEAMPRETRRSAPADQQWARRCRSLAAAPHRLQTELVPFELFFLNRHNLDEDRVVLEESLLRQWKVPDAKPA